MPLAMWQAEDRSQMSKSEKKADPRHQARLNRREIRANLGEDGEKDWTNSPHDTADQFSSSKGYVRGGMGGIVASW